MLAEFFRSLKERERQTTVDAAGRLAEADALLEKAFAEAAAEFDSGLKRLTATFDLASADRPCSGAALKKTADEIDGFLVFLGKKMQPALERELFQFAPKKKLVLSLVENVLRAQQEAVAALPAELIQPRHGLRLLPPRKIPLRALVTRVLPSVEDLSSHPLVRGYEETYAASAAALAALWRGVRFHLETAAAELEEGVSTSAVEPAEVEDLFPRLDGARMLTLAALDDARKKLFTLGAALRDFLRTIPSGMEEEWVLLHVAPAAELEWAGFLRSRFLRFGRSLKRLPTRLSRRLQKLLAQERRDWVQYVGGIRSRLVALKGRLAALLGWETPPEQTLLQFTDLPSPAEVLLRAEKLPLLFRRLYTLGPLKNREFLVAREDELTTFEGLYQRWAAGRACSVAVIGPEGSGKTSLVNSFESEFGFEAEVDRKIIARRLRGESDVLHLFAEWFRPGEPFGGLDEVVEFLHSRPGKILIIEQGHNIFLRTIGGRRGVEAFLYVLMATRRHLLWVVTFRKVAWQRLDYLLGMSRYFTHQVPTLFHSQETIRAAILLRQETSGLPLAFLPREGEPAADSAETKKSLEDRFFHELFVASGGNIEAALFYWLLSLDYDAEEAILKVSPLAKLSYGALRALDQKYLFALAEVVSHGGLSPEEHGSIFRCTLLESRLVLGYLAQLNLLMIQGGKNCELPVSYTFNPIFFGPVTATLQSMNILY
ncbi:hypothetical protein DSOUD_3053 [Desulfuromonas soudanensis]|uniref:Uncharacterized protein n=2 Tax=Desulfuromonas soudanensis TaxID=1603606 RepID=A0A0M3QGD3_9BACT|nr:hypothetical protein DSOUD_3053 [Desulfuromonas soudanensis]